MADSAGKEDPRFSSQVKDHRPFNQGWGLILLSGVHSLGGNAGRRSSIVLAVLGALQDVRFDEEPWASSKVNIKAPSPEFKRTQEHRQRPAGSGTC